MLKAYIWLKDKLQGERGQDMVEYALITVLVSVAIVLAVWAILPTAFETWADAVEGCISDPNAGSCFPVA